MRTNTILATMLAVALAFGMSAYAGGKACQGGECGKKETVAAKGDKKEADKKGEQKAEQTADKSSEKKEEKKSS